MTKLDEYAPATSGEKGIKKTRLKRLALIAVVGLVAAAFLIWFFVIRSTSPESVNTDAAAEARQEALDAVSSESQPTTPVDNSAETTVAVPGLDGTWLVDTSIGSFDKVCLTDVCDTTFVGFRIDEELVTFGAKTVVGRSPGVVGSMEIEGTTIVGTEMTVDMTQLITDNGSRTNTIREQAIETDLFPDASFSLAEPIELGELPADGESIEIAATGELTIHGVTRTETIPLQAELAGEVVVVFGELGPILLADYNIEKPSAAVVLSIEDDAIMEFQLFFTR